MVEVEVEFDYSAQESDELTIKKGDIIKNVVRQPGGWWAGTLNGKTGVFPDNFVKIVVKDGVSLRNPKESTRIRRQCRALFSYVREQEDELTIKTGDIITVIGEEEVGWWRGLLNGREGVFPSNFVEELEVQSSQASSIPQPTSRGEAAKEPVPALPARPVKQLCRARFSYEAQNADELTVSENDLITILSTDGADPGWWKGELNGKVGWFPDNFVQLVEPLPSSTERTKAPAKPDATSPSSNKVDSKPSSDGSAIKPTSAAVHTKSPKNAPAKPPETKTTPPLPGKKPLISGISLKKSPSGSGGGLFSKIKDKIADAVDGATGSKPDNKKEAKENHVTENASTNATSATTFDQVDRRPLLNDVRANRVRAPGRRLPTSIYKEDEDEIPGLPNGTADHSKLDHSTKSEDSFKSEGSASSENLDSSDLDASGDAKPKLREWEKHKAPWLEEMKLNQAKRTSVSPVPELRPKSQQPSTAETKQPEPEATSKSSQNSPAEREVNVPDMSKSMSEMKMGPMEVKPIPKPQKTSPSEVERAPPIKSKPVVPSLPSVNRHSLGSVPREIVFKPLPQPLLVRATPKPRAEQYENVVPQKQSATTVATSTSSSGVIIATEKSSTTITTSSSLASSIVSTVSKPEKEETTPPGFNLKEILDRLAKLEAKCDKQGQQIEDLKNRLQVESELRMILQEKVLRNNVQV